MKEISRTRQTRKTEVKVYTIIFDYTNRQKIVTGTMSELLEDWFSYTLELGHSYDKSIKLTYKSMKSLINAVNKSLKISGSYSQSVRLG